MDNNLLSLLGFNAPNFDDSNTCFQPLNNKSLGNGKQYDSFTIDNTSGKKITPEIVLRKSF